MDAKEYKITITTPKISNEFEIYGNQRLNPIRKINFTVFSYDYENAENTALNMCPEIAGHEFDEEMDTIDIEEVIINESKTDYFDSDYNQFS